MIVPPFITRASRRTPKTTPSTFTLDGSPVLLVGQLREVGLGGENAGVQAGKVDRLDALPRCRVGDVEAGDEIEGLDLVALALQFRAHRPAEPALTAGDERSHGSRTTFPTCFRDSISACAADAAASGKVAPTAGSISPRAHMREQVGGTVAHELRVVLHQPAEKEALHADVAPDEPLHARIRPEAGRKPDRNDVAERLQDREGLRERVAADGVEDDVDRERVELVVPDCAVGALRTRIGALLVGARRCDHVRAEALRELDRRGADTARAGMHEHRSSHCARAPDDAAGCTPSDTS